jgi:hypothetical protein
MSTDMNRPKDVVGKMGKMRVMKAYRHLIKRPKKLARKMQSTKVTSRYRAPKKMKSLLKAATRIENTIATTRKWRLFRSAG